MSDCQLDICMLQYVQSLIPDDGRTDGPKHVESNSNKINLIHWCHLVGFTIEIHYDARP